MRASEFKNAIKDHTPKQLIYMHTTEKIYLTPNQIDRLLEIKNKQPEPRSHLDKPRKIKLKTKIYTSYMKIRGVLND